MMQEKVINPSSTSYNYAGILAWIVCLSASLFFFYSFVQMMMFNAIDSDLMLAFSIKATGIGKLSSAYFYANVLFMFPAGLLLDRFSTRKIILMTLLLCILGTALFSIANNFAFAIFCRFLTGVGGAFPFLSCLRLASRWFPPRRMALVSGIILTIAMLGGMTSQTPLVLLVSKIGWRHALQLDALLGILFLLIIFILVRDFPKNYEHHLQEGQATSLSYLWYTIKKAVRNKETWLFGLYTCMLNLPIFLLGAIWGEPYLVQARNLSVADASLITSMLFVGCIFGSPMIGWFSDRIGKRRMPMLVCGFISILVMAIIMYLPTLNFVSLLFLFFILGFITSSQVLSYPAIAECNEHELVGSALGLASVLIMLGGVVFQPMFGWLMDLHWDGQYVNHVPYYSVHDYHMALIILPIAFIVGIISVLMTKETLR